MVTDLEDAVNMMQGTRGRPAKKKPKFEAKFYNLTPPQIKPSLRNPEDVNDKRGAIVSMNKPVTSPIVMTSAIHNPSSSSCHIRSLKQHRTEEPKVTDYAALRNSTILLDNSQNHPSIQTSHIGEHSVRTIYSQGSVSGDPILAGQETPLRRFAEVTNIAQQPNMFCEGDERQYIGLGNGCYMELFNEQNNQVTDSRNDVSSYDDLGCETLLQVAPEIQIDSAESDHLKVIGELQKVHARLDNIEGRLNQVLSFMANIDKFMPTKPASSTEKRRDLEDFGEFRELCPILSENDLQMLETNLKIKVYADKFFRFFDSEYNLNGKRDGKAFFKTVIRRLLSPILLKPFSWKGNSRKTNELVPFIPNRSFRSTFPCMVQFFQRVLFAADMDHTAEDTEKCFSQFLRQKKIEIQRFLEGSNNKRTACSRTRKPKKDPQTFEEANLEQGEHMIEVIMDHDTENISYTEEYIDNENFSG